MTLIKKLAFTLMVCFVLPMSAQKAGNVPEKFTISEKDLATLIAASTDVPVNLPDNKYLHKAVAVKNVRTGDMRYVRLRLVYFKDAYLTVQVNGQFTTQVFVLSEKGNAFYKGEAKDGRVEMEKCSKDDIVVE